MTVVKAWVLVGALVVTPVVASAQTSRTPDSETIRARQKISMIEGMFERAVQNGADNFSRQLQTVAPNADGMAMLMGAPQVRGFRMPDRGLFFDVLMPSLQLSMVWPLRYNQNADAATASLLADLRNSLEKVSDPQTRQELNQKIRQVELRMAGASAGRRGVAGATPVASLQGGGAAPPPPVSAVDMGILDDPAEAWRNEVRSTLIDALIENTGGVTIGADEYIYVAARGVLSSDRVADPGESRTMELRLKGSDLDAARSHSITLEEARKRVEVREY